MCLSSSASWEICCYSLAHRVGLEEHKGYQVVCFFVKPWVDQGIWIRSRVCLIWFLALLHTWSTYRLDWLLLGDDPWTVSPWRSQLSFVFLEKWNPYSYGQSRLYIQSLSSSLRSAVTIRRNDLLPGFYIEGKE